MKRLIFTLKTLPFLCGILFLGGKSYAQAPVEKILVVSPAVGEVIDFEEKAYFKLFPFYPDSEFQTGRFLQNEAGQIFLETMFKNGKIVRRPFTKDEFDLTNQLIAARAAAPVVNSAPPVNTAPSPVGADTSKIDNSFSGVGKFSVDKKVYYIILNNDRKFFATIVKKNGGSYVFKLDDGRVETIPFMNIKYMRETDSQLHRGRYWIPAPHDSRLFFGPTGRGLKRGDGYVQDIELFLVSANVGFTDNLSVGGMLSLMPGVPLEDQLYSFTPKMSFQTSRNTSVAGGVLLVGFGGETFGVAYAAGTYGSSNNHLTGGIGYGFFNGKVSSTPALMAGGVVRASNRIALMSENYIIPNGAGSLSFGLYGVRFIWPVVNFDMGAAYAYSKSESGEWSGFTTYVYPVYYSLTFKFGNRKIVGKAE